MSFAINLQQSRVTHIEQTVKKAKLQLSLFAIISQQHFYIYISCFYCLILQYLSSANLSVNK